MEKVPGTDEVMEPLKRLTKDMRTAASVLSAHEARFLVDAYYMMQEDRKRSGNQMLALGQSGEPHVVLQWLFDQNKMLEAQLKGALDKYSAANTVGQWAREQVGIGPVIAAGLLAHIDIEKAPTAGHIWRYAGLDPSVIWPSTEDAKAWLKENGLDIDKAAAHFGRTTRSLARFACSDADGKPRALTEKNLATAISRRPWNGNLKVLCWKIGESFVKVSGNPKARYGQYYLSRKAYEAERNEEGAYAKQAARILEVKNIGKTTDAYKAYSQGRLPLGHLHERAKRYAVKLFLSHYHHVAYEDHFGEAPPKPFAIEHLGHAHYDKP